MTLPDASIQKAWWPLREARDDDMETDMRDTDSHDTLPLGLTARRADGHIELDWSDGQEDETRYRLLRSEQGFASSAGALAGSGQVVVGEGAIKRLRDEAVKGAATYFYTVFRQDLDGVWHRAAMAGVPASF